MISWLKGFFIIFAPKFQTVVVDTVFSFFIEIKWTRRIAILIYLDLG
jgi:hypothetical protein